MDDFDEDFFSDDGFDDIPSGTLFQLEQNAFRTTQALQQNSQPSPAPAEPPPELPPGTTATQDLRQTDAVNASLQPLRPYTGLSNEFGYVDVGELDAEVLDDDTGGTSALEQAIAFAEQAPQQQQQQGYGPVVEDNGQVFNASVDYMMEDVQGEQPYYTGANESYNEPAEKSRSEPEWEEMLKRLAEARSLAETRAGEIAIIRSNQAKMVQEHDQRLAAMRKSREESEMEHKEKLDASLRDTKILATENAFYQQDVAEERRSIDPRLKMKITEKAPPVTPKKTKTLPFRDGFDDDEIIAVSPSKSAAARSKQPNPVVPGKRKRQLSQDSPTKLQLSRQPESIVEEAPGNSPDDPMLLDNDEQNRESSSRPSPKEEPPKVDANLQFMKCILDHRTFPNEERDLEVMKAWSLPSEPQRRLSSIILEGVAKLDAENYVVGYAGIIASLWTQALKENFFKPVPMFMEIINFLLGLDMCSPVPDMIDHLVPVLQDSGDVNGIPRFKHSPVYNENQGLGRQTPLSALQQDVDSTEALRLLYRIASGSLHVEQALEKFWRHMRYEFVLMMTHCSQPIQDIILTLNLLGTSVRENSFGPIHEGAKADQIESWIVDRAANLLSEIPKGDEGQKPPTRIEICTMRLEALSLLMAVAFPPTTTATGHGSFVIASHPTVLARLIRATYDELDELYSYTPERDMRASLVNGLMRLVYGVIRRHEGVDLQLKLGRLNGGKQKFLVVLTRLAFSEGLVLEEGIDDETVEMAHEMLDAAVNPQEAEALLDAFPSAKQD